MKELFGILFLLTIYSPLVSADIQLEWEYTVGSNDFPPLANPPTDPISGPQYGITRIKVGASGHTLLLMERFYEITTIRRLAMLDPQGKRIWLSDDLPDIFSQTTQGFRILNVSTESATLAFNANSIPAELVMLSINLKSSPQISQLSMPGYQLAESSGNSAMGLLDEIPSTFPPNTFYTVGNPPGYMGGVMNSLGTILRKYSLNTLASIPLVVASESGTNGNNFVIRWQSTVNVSYQVQQSINMAAWTDVGQALTGNGTQLSYSTPLGTGNKFYRIVQR